MDFFTLFSLPRHLHIDTAALEKAFYAQSRKLHPDRFAAKPQAEQDAALAASSQLNDAYRTLRDPIARTEYLLSLEGIQLEEQSRAATDAAKAAGTEKKQVAPPDLLEEAFELNMALEELKMGDDPDARAQLESERTKFTAMLAEDASSSWKQFSGPSGTRLKTAQRYNRQKSCRRAGNGRSAQSEKLHPQSGARC